MEFPTPVGENLDKAPPASAELCRALPSSPEPIRHRNPCHAAGDATAGRGSTASAPGFSRGERTSPDAPRPIQPGGWLLATGARDLGVGRWALPCRASRADAERRWGYAAGRGVGARARP
ncbi:PEP-CTERM system TPR-repeat lipoprotein [Marssonina coronariae]|uniref:PEP-CTERM system TPR-repeat lipoprotein n=1 Tax=Diplocarpon coronariae TaxID=2795749 RepID=A0A218YTB7_9HELO|nr:PEP-CTERM system TPR-repeat lipoprotein [Marssonina coronariae]